MEWNFSKSARKCAGCEQPFPTGEFFFSAIFSPAPDETKGRTKDVENFIRRDYCEPCWGKKPEGIFSFWKTRLTPKTPPKTPREVLVEFFDNLLNPTATSLNIDDAIRTKVSYLFSLVLLRRKIVKIKENITKDNQPYLVLERIPDGKIYEVPELSISEDELVTLREQFSGLFEFKL